METGAVSNIAAATAVSPSTHNALSRALLDFSNQLVPYLTEQRYASRLIYSGGDDVLAYSNLWEWNRWLWDIRECFRGAADPQGEFSNEGNYWRYQGTIPTDKKGNALLANRPLFTMGNTATLSFGITLVNHAVPLAIALVGQKIFLLTERLGKYVNNKLLEELKILFPELVI